MVPWGCSKVAYLSESVLEDLHHLWIEVVALTMRDFHPQLDRNYKLCLGTLVCIVLYNMSLLLMPYSIFSFLDSINLSLCLSNPLRSFLFEPSRCFSNTSASLNHHFWGQPTCLSYCSPWYHMLASHGLNLTLRWVSKSGCCSASHCHIQVYCNTYMKPSEAQKCVQLYIGTSISEMLHVGMYAVRSRKCSYFEQV